MFAAGFVVGVHTSSLGDLSNQGYKCLKMGCTVGLEVCIVGFEACIENIAVVGKCQPHLLSLGAEDMHLWNDHMQHKYNTTWV